MKGAPPLATAFFSLLSLASLTTFPLTAAPGDLDDLDAEVTGSYLLTTIVQPDGKILIGGDFAQVQGESRQYIARLNADGSLDTFFDPKANNLVYCLAVQADGKILLGGDFTSLQPNGTPVAVPRSKIARLNPDGSLDMTFDPKTNGSVYSLAVQGDGKILIGGVFSTLQPNGVPAPISRNSIARLLPDGSLDTAFDPNANHNVFGLAVQSDGKILLGGLFTSLQPNGAPSGTARQYMARLLPDGSLDNSFDPKANNWVGCMTVQKDGKIVMGGSFTSLQPNGAPSATPRNRIARLHPDGSLDETFNPNANNTVWGLALQADEKILLGGGFTSLQPNGSPASTARSFVARLQSDGSLDSSFDPKTNHWVYSLAMQADGRILLGGIFSTLQPNGSVTPDARHLFARLQNDPALQMLEIPSGSQVSWLRGGAGPELSRASFDLSTDGGTTWTPLGEAARVGSTADWELTNLSLPTSGTLRARGIPTGGVFNGSQSLIEQTASFVIIVDPVITLPIQKGDAAPG
ncbi:MAG: delta-60 repeat domain-containing protein, partial [Verrucomicrobiae bacterium]|nr:delta-60 repeat domain-containing protein [Verrucomicrobiae bacterium]